MLDDCGGQRLRGGSVYGRYGAWCGRAVAFPPAGGLRVFAKRACFCDFDGLVCVEGKVFTGVSILHGYDLPGGRGRGRAGRADPASAPQREWRDCARAFA